MERETTKLREAAQNLVEAARTERDPKKARKLLDGAKRLNRWRVEGIPAHLA